MSDEREDAIPPVISEMIDATNRGDSDGFVATFADDADITDYGREFHGREGARSWDRTDNIGVSMHFDLLGVTRIAPDRYDVLIDAQSRRFTGRSTLKITLRDGLIASLETS